MKIKESVRPYNINNTTWVYREKNKLLFYHEEYDKESNYVRTISFSIPRHKLRKWLKP